MSLREDEIESLLKFDHAKLAVLNFSDLTAQAGQPYAVIITSADGRMFAGNGETRIEAIHAAWETYQRFMNAPIGARHNGYWLYENALAEVERRRWENLKGGSG